MQPEPPSEPASSSRASLENLQRSSELLSLVLETTPDRIILYDPQGRFLFANPAALESMGRSRETVNGLTWREVGLPPEVGASFEERFRAVLQDGRPVRAELTFPGEDPRQLESILSPVLDEQGRIRAVLNILRDITERRHSEEVLRADEEKYRSLLEQAADGILLGSLEGVIIGANSMSCEMTGYSKAELIGMHISSLFTPETLLRAPLRLDLVKAGHRVISEREILRRDGSSLPIEMNTKLMPDGTCQAFLRDLTERQRSQLALRESEASYRGLFDSVQDAIYIQDREGRFLDVNRGAQEMYGRAKEFFIGRTPEVVSAPGMNDLAHLETLTRRAFEGEPQRFEFWGLRANGEVFPKEVRICKGTYFGKEVIIALAQDISERMRAEKALRESEQQSRELLERLQEGFAFADTEERFVFANPAASVIFGVPEGLKGRCLKEFVDPATFQEIARRTEARKRGESGQYELPIRRPDGEVRLLSLHVNPWLGEHGEYLGSSGLFQDITGRKLAENALRETQERYQELFDNTTDAIFWIRVEDGGNFSIESINPAEEARCGRPSGELAGRSIREILPEHLAVPVAANFRKCMEAGRPLRYEETVELPEGAKTFQTLLVPIRDASQRIARIVGFSQDITQSKQAEEALRQAQKLESLGVLAGGIAHDFNNLLTAVLGNLNLAQLKSAPEAPALPYLENIERTVLKAAELTKQMLAYSGKGRFVVKPHDLNQVVQEMTHLLNVSISKKVLIRYDLAPDLHPIEADAAQIQQVVMNLVTNASEAIGDRDGVISIATRMQFLDRDLLRSAFANQNLEPGAHAILEISDTGCGIAPEIRGKIFDPFFSTKQSGRGLGLSAMQGILRGHRAGILIDSAPGEGSTFTLFFPVAPASSPAKEPAGSVEPEHRFHGRILLVDDEEEVRSSTAAMLETLGFHVITAEDGQDALDRFAFEGDDIDLVLLDLTMPRLDGRETFRELRRLRADLPVILFSGYSEHESLGETLSQGFSGFLQKPFLMADLRRAIQHVRDQG